MRNYLLIDSNNICVGTIIWDGISPLSLQEGQSTIQYDGPGVIGWVWDGTRTTPPAAQTTTQTTQMTPSDTYLIIGGGVCVNCVKWDGVSPFALPEGQTLVPYSGRWGVGWVWDGTSAIQPPSSPITTPPGVSGVQVIA